MPLPAGSLDILATGILSHRSSTGPSSPNIQGPGIKHASQEPLDRSHRALSDEATSMIALSSAHGPASNNSPSISAHVAQKLQPSSTRVTSTLPSPSLTNEPSPGATSSTAAETLSLPALLPALPPGSAPRQPTPLAIISPNAQELESNVRVETERLSMQPPVAHGQRGTEDDDDVIITEHRQKRARQDEGSAIFNAQVSLPEALRLCHQIVVQRMQEPDLLSTQASIGSARFAILRDACASGDLFYVVLHRFFCLWTLDPLRALAAFQNNPAMTNNAFNQLSVVMRNNKDMSTHHLAWLSSFPEFLSQIQGFGEVCLQISAFIDSFATGWKPLLGEIANRRYPLLVWEARARLRSQSTTLENILFTLSRRSIGIHEGQIASDMGNLFAEDQKKECDLASIGATANQVKVTRELMVGLHRSLMSRAQHETRTTEHATSSPNPGSQLQPSATPSQTSRPPALQPSQLPQPPPPSSDAQRLHPQQQQPLIVQQSPANPNLALPIMPQTHTIHPQPQTPVPNNSQAGMTYYGTGHPLHTQANGSNLAGPVHPGIVLGSSQPRRKSNPVSSNPGRTASMPSSVVHHNTTWQLPNLRYSVSATNTESAPSPHHPMAEQYPRILPRQGSWPTVATQPSIPVAPHTPAQSQAQSQAQAQARAQVLAQIQPQTQSHVHVPVHQTAHLQSPQNVQYNNVQAAYTQPSIPSFTASTFQPSSFTNSRPMQDMPGHAHLISPVQQSPVLTSSPQSIQPMQQPFQSEGEPQPFRPQFTTRRLNVHEYPSGVHDHTSLQCGLHLINLRSPKRVPATLISTRYYQFFDKFFVLPTVIEPQIGITTLQFDLPPDTPPNTPSCLASPAGLPVSRYFNGCHRYRLRLCQRRENQAAMTEATWAIHRSHWPSDIYVSFNRQPQMLRRKQHFHHDLPIELTDSVAQGRNLVHISLPNRPGNLLLGTVYLAAVERIITLDHESVWSLVTNGQHITVAETKLVLQKRLRPSDSDDIVVENDTLMVSVVDPFSSQIYDLPVRGLECKHLECIDLKNWLETRPGKSPHTKLEPTMVDVWKCPICGLDARPNSLRIDDFFVDVCQKLSAGDNRNVKKIQISADGAWIPVLEPDDIKDPGPDSATAETAQRNSTGPVPETIEIPDDD